VITTDRPESTDAAGLPGDGAVPLVAPLWQEVARNEETRFNNLNTRAVGVLTIASLVTAIAGFFAKDVQSTMAFSRGWVRGLCAGLLAAALALLAFSALLTVLGVLWPRRRALFGQNSLTTAPTTFQDSLAVQRLIITEYSKIARTLQARNRAKARSLTLAYSAVAAAVLTITTAGIAFALNAVFA
jgi:hypothetical protein